MFTVGNLITILKTYDKNTPVVMASSAHIDIVYLENIDGIEEVKFKGKLALQII